MPIGGAESTPEGMCRGSSSVGSGEQGGRVNVAAHAVEDFARGVVFGLDYPVGECRAVAAPVAQRRAEGLGELGTAGVLAVLPRHPQCPGAEIELYLGADNVVEVEHRQLRQGLVLSPQRVALDDPGGLVDERGESVGEGEIVAVGVGGAPRGLLRLTRRDWLARRGGIPGTAGCALSPGSGAGVRSRDVTGLARKSLSLRSG